MKAIRISRTGGSDVLEHVEVPTPVPGPGEVLVKAEAIGVNYFDLLIRTGKYRWMPALPFLIGNEMSGRVVARGPGADRLAIGQAVFVAGYEIGNRGGLYAEYAAVPEDSVFVLPDGLSCEAATALTNYQLAWILMHHAARGVTAGSVAVRGAAGGVGTALIDVARKAGARVIGMAGGEAKCAFVRSRGAHHVVDHTQGKVSDHVLEATGGEGVDILFDHVAGDGFGDGLAMLAPFGMIVSYAVIGGIPRDNLFAAMRHNIENSPAIRCFTMHTYDHKPKPRREAMQRAVELLAAGDIHPAIAARFPLAEAARAHDLVESRSALGKIVLVP